MLIGIKVKTLLMIGDDGVKELQRKRHSATPGVSIRGRVRKAAKLQDESDVESDLESESNFLIHIYRKIALCFSCSIFHYYLV